EQALRQIAERDAFRLALSESFRDVPDPSEAGRICCRELGRHLRADQASYAATDVGGGAVTRAAWGTAGETLASEIELPTALRSELEKGRAVVTVEASGSASPGLAGGGMQPRLPSEEQVMVPLLRHGQLAAFLSVKRTSGRAWEDAEVGLI